MNWLLVEENVKRALNEDLQYGDITTESVVLDHKIAKVDIIAKEKGVIAGTEVFKMVFKILGDVEVDFSVNDGEEVERGQHFGQVSGDAKKILMGERVALNYMQRMCGIATLTREFVERLEGTKVKLLDTRKTTPNMRIFEKYAVKVGGGTNHRFGLNDGVMIKDNHIEAAGGIKNAVSLARKNSPFVRKIEVEVESIEQLKEALEAKADIIMLGPQVRYLFNSLRKKVDSNIPITLINSADYGTMNGNRILNQALALMDNKELSTNNL